MNGLLALPDVDWAADRIVAWLGHALLYGTLLAALTGLITAVLRRRASAAIHTLLWSIVLIKFLIPVGPSWSHSLASVWQRCSLSPSEAFPKTGFVEPARMPTERPTTEVPDEAVIRPHGENVSPTSWAVPTALAYVTVVLGLAVARLRSYRAFRARCRALPLADAATRRRVAGVCQRLGLRWIPTTRISDEPPAPFVMGVFRPMLVLCPRHLVRPDELETVIVHEVAHFRRGDMLVQHLQRIAGVLLFFWPVVACVNRRIDTAREFACDEWALRHGRLTAGEYAQCLLNATRLTRTRRLAGRLVCMAGHPSTIERRINVILESPTRSPKRPAWGLPTIVLLLAWGGFSLAGAAGPTQTAGAEHQAWPAAAPAVKEHAIQVYNLVAEHAAADFDGDGVLSYREKSAYLVALAMQVPEAFMEEFPYADRDHSGRLDCLEAYGVIRGITLVAYADRRPTAATEEVLPLEFCHMALGAQKWLVDNMTREPGAEDLENINAVIRRIEGPPNLYHHRMLDHGGPESPRRGKGRAPDELRRFKELEANIAVVEARLADAKDPQEIARLKAMLGKLETILAKLNATVDELNETVEPPDKE